MFHYDQISDGALLFGPIDNSTTITLNTMLHYVKNGSYGSDTEYFNWTHMLTIPEEHYTNIISVANSTLEKIRTKATRRSNACFCSKSIRALGDAYKNEAHGMFSLAVCAFGIIANLLNIVVLTRRELTVAPINKILTGLAVTDLLVMIEYVPFTIYKYLGHKTQTTHFTYAGSLFVLIHMHFSQLLHTVSIFQTLTLAICRYVVIRFPHKCSLCNETNYYTSLLMSYILPLLICAPSYFIFGIQQVRVIENQQPQILYQLHLSKLAREHNGLFFSLHFWLYSVFIKLIPCLVLSVISYYLVEALRSASRRKHLLKANSMHDQGKTEKRMDRTAHMLVAVLLLFLITEFPQGILALLSGVLGRCFFESCYQPYGEVMDILALLNGAINFILYCCMSRQFRVTFGQLFKPKNVLGKIVMPTVQSTEVQSTCV